MVIGTKLLKQDLLLMARYIHQTSPHQTHYCKQLDHQSYYHYKRLTLYRVSDVDIKTYSLMEINWLSGEAKHRSDDR